jgi:uncharacterized protein (UPF0332 family)
MWHGSKAEMLLKKDIDEERHKAFSTRDLWQTRDEYKQFSSKKFIKHVHQELNSRKQSMYWQNKKSKKKKFIKHINKLFHKQETDENENDEDADAFSL